MGTIQECYVQFLIDPESNNLQNSSECRLEDQPRIMEDRDGWRERARKNRAVSTT